MLTPLAIEKALYLQETHPEWRDLNLRLYIEGKGCDGFYYGVTFDASQEADYHWIFSDPEGKKLVLVCDKDTFQFVDGCEIDWVDDVRGQGFLVNNPRQTKFRGKFFKRKVWLEQFTKNDSKM